MLFLIAYNALTYILSILGVFLTFNILNNIYPYNNQAFSLSGAKFIHYYE